MRWDCNNVTGRRSPTFLLQDDFKNSFYSKLIWPFGGRDTAGKKAFAGGKDSYPKQRPVSPLVNCSAIKDQHRSDKKGQTKQVTSILKELPGQCMPSYSRGSLLPELVSTLRGLLEEVSAAVPLGVFWAALAAAANAARFCNCIAFSPATQGKMPVPPVTATMTQV